MKFPKFNLTVYQEPDQKDQWFGIPRRQLLARWMMRRHSPCLGSFRLEKQYVKLIFYTAGKEPYHWKHYGDNCICCLWGWHR